MLNIKYIKKDLKAHIESLSAEELLNELENAGLEIYQNSQNFINDEIELSFDSEHKPLPEKNFNFRYLDIEYLRNKFIGPFNRAA